MIKEEKKRLLIFHPTIAQYRIVFFNDLSKEFDIRICLSDYYNNTFNFIFNYAQLKKEPIRLESRSKGIWKQIDSYKPDMVLVNEFGLGTISVLLHRFIKRRSYKTISICDDSYNMLAEGNDFSLKHKWARRFLVSFLDDILVVEPKVEEWYQEKYRKGFFFPIIRDAIKQRNVYQFVLRNSIELMHNNHLECKNVFLYVGRFVAIKNIETIIKAFSSLDQKENVLVLVGSGEEERKLKNLVSYLNVNAIFTGRLEGNALYVWYNIADYFVLASYKEPFGAVTNEALLAGCYCLVSEKAGSRCLIQEGKNGYTFSPMNVDELTGKMRLLLKIFPKKRPLDQVKPNLMNIDYHIRMRDLINHIASL